MTKKTKKYIEDNPKSMILVKSAFGNLKSFKLLPISNDCPWVECLFSPNEKILVIISKFMKSSYHMVPKLDDNGDDIPVKGKVRANGKLVKEERRAMDTCSEHYVVTEEEIRDIVNMFCVNPDAVDLDEFFLSDSDLVGVDTAKDTGIIIV
ncbi:MAG: hypothetical protein H8E16_18215 [Flavobacteriales bacterium]|nr:hypothetical protein [Flavobacteriales bacterium]